MRKPIGGTGGIASGKSTADSMLSDLGAYIISADEIAQQVLCMGSPAVKALVKNFGDIIVTDGDVLNRTKMLDILLQDSVHMKRQLDVLRPFIIPAVDKKVKEANIQFPKKKIIVDAPLLFEYGRADRYSRIIVVSVSRRIQIERLIKRSGMKRDRAGKVVDLQIPIEKKEKSHMRFINMESIMVIFFIIIEVE